MSINMWLAHWMSKRVRLRTAAEKLDTATIEMPPLALPEEPRVPGSSFVLPANPLTEMTDDLLDAFIESTVTNASLPPPAIPEPVLADRTVRTPSRDLISGAGRLSSTTYTFDV